MPNNKCHKETGQCKNSPDTEHVHIRGKRLMWPTNMQHIISITINCSSSPLEEVLDIHNGLSRTVSLFKEWVKNWAKKDLHKNSQKDHGIKSFSLSEKINLQSQGGPKKHSNSE